MSKQMFNAGNVVGALEGFDEILRIFPIIRGEEFSIAPAAIQNRKLSIESIRRLRKTISYHWETKSVGLKVSKLAGFAKRYLNLFRHLRGEKRGSQLPLSGPSQGVQYARAVCLMQLGRLDEAETAARGELALQPEDKKCAGLLKQIQSLIDRAETAGRLCIKL
jgi:hypothetical protein